MDELMDGWMDVDLCLTGKHRLHSIAWRGIGFLWLAHARNVTDLVTRSAHSLLSAATYLPVGLSLSLSLSGWLGSSTPLSAPLLSSPLLAHCVHCVASFLVVF